MPRRSPFNNVKNIPVAGATGKEQRDLEQNRYDGMTTLLESKLALPPPTESRVGRDDGDQWAVLAGIRFLLASWVMLGHSFVYYTGDYLPKLNMLSGTLPVLGFFVISGYSIASSVLSRPQGFAIRRINRLAPTYYASLAFSLLPVFIYGAQFSGANRSLEPFTIWQVLATSFVLQGWVTVTPQFCRPLWSLSCEVFYYLFATRLAKTNTAFILMLIALSYCLDLLWQNSKLPQVPLSAYGLAPLCLFWVWLIGFLIQRIIGNFNCAKLPARLSKTLIYLGELSYPLYATHVTVFWIASGCPYIDHSQLQLIYVSCITAIIVSAIFYHSLKYLSKKRRVSA